MRVSTLTSIALVSLALSGPVFAQGTHSGGHGHGHGQSHGQNHEQGHGQMNHSAMKSSPRAAKAEFDHQFIDTMKVHHQSAVEMARLVDKRAEHDELKQLAKKMIEDQEKEIKQLQGWKEQWYAGKGDAINMKLPGMAESMKDMSMDKLSAASGKAFDTLFIDMMTRHHRGAVKMAQDALGKAKHSEVKELARNVIDAQKKEIAQMAAWKKEWKLAAK